MALITLMDVHLGFGGPDLLDGIDLSVERGERICLIGRNGSGKSTLMKVVAGELGVDDGTLARRQGITVARLHQEVPEGIHGSVFEVVAGALGTLAELITRRRRVSRRARR